MNDNLLTWSVKNWITVFLMFMLAWAIIALGGRVLVGKLGRRSKPANPAGTFVQPGNFNVAYGT